jgi:D-galactarolactone isomerase
MPPSKRQAPSNGTVAEYRLLQKRIGTTRSVVVQPRNYATDNEVTLDALKQLAPNSRGVAVVHPTITDSELKRFNDAGVRGSRFSLGDPATAVVTPDMIEPLAKRVANLGWHISPLLDGTDPAYAARAFVRAGFEARTLSISSNERPFVSMPRTQKATAACPYQNAR